jgi:phosphatidate cytidylyltransferase
MSENSNKTAYSDLITRTISAIFLIALICFALFYHPSSFNMLLLIGFVIGMREWRKLRPDGMFFPLHYLFGFIIIGLCCVSLSRLNVIAQHPDLGSALPVLILFGIVWSVDISGYFVGKAIGGPLCWPKVSAKKTWSGTLAGLLFGTLTGVFTLHALWDIPLTPILITSILAVSIAAIFGDFYESLLKRKAGVKDSGALIPGHGGLLDRIDGLLFSAPLLLLIFYYIIPLNAASSL